MGLWTPPQRQVRDFFGITGAEDLIPGRTGGGARQVGTTVVTDEKAMRHSVVWACLGLRAGLVSTFPLDVFRDVLGIQVQVTKPPVLTDPGGARMGVIDWLAASQVDLDRAGNAVGLIVERSAVKSRYHPKGLPARVELQQASSCAYYARPGKPDRWRIGNRWYDLDDVYHERKNVVPGLAVGLPTVLYAALSVGEAMSMQDFGLNWFAGGGVPKAMMRNTAKKLDDAERSAVKGWFSDVVHTGDVLVTGLDWEYEMIQAQTAGMEFIEGRRMSAVDICRFFDTPADMVDASPSSSGGMIRYANITQRNLQYLIYHIGPTIIRREDALNRLLPAPRYVKFNTDGLLRMDPETRQKVLRSRVESWLLTNTEARELENLPALTAAQRTEMTEIYGGPKGKSTGAAGGTGQQDDEQVPAAVGG